MSTLHLQSSVLTDCLIVRIGFELERNRGGTNRARIDPENRSHFSSATGIVNSAVLITPFL